MNRSKNIGTAVESAACRTLHGLGFPGCERRALAGSSDRGDLLIAPGLIGECKGGKAAETASLRQIDAWMAETERERVNARADVALLVVKRKGVGADRAHLWAAYLPVWQLLPVPSDDPQHMAAHGMTLAHAAWLLRRMGYGTPMED